MVNTLGVIVRGTRTLYLIVFNRTLGAEGFGIYLLAFAAQEIISKFSMLGLNWGVKQEVGKLRSRGDDVLIRVTVLKLLVVVMLFSSFAALLLALEARVLAQWLGEKALAGPLRIFAAGLPFLCGIYFLVYSFRPRLNMKYEFIVVSVIEPLGVLLVGMILLRANRHVEMLAVAHVSATVLAFLAAIYFFNKLYPATVKGRKAAIDWRELLRGSAAMGGLEVIVNLQSKVSLFVLALYYAPDVIGIYGAAALVAWVFQSFKSAIDPILLPIAQSHFLSNNRRQMQDQVTRATTLAMLGGLTLFGMIILLPEHFLALFGSAGAGAEFTTVLIVLAAGQFIYMSLGLSEGLLSITGYGFVSLKSAALLIIAEVALLFVLVPVFGVVGAALATSLPFVLVSVWRGVKAKRLLGINVIAARQVLIPMAWVWCLLLAFGAGFMPGVTDVMAPFVSAGVLLATFAIFAATMLRPGRTLTWLCRCRGRRRPAELPTATSPSQPVPDSAIRPGFQ